MANPLAPLFAAAASIAVGAIGKKVTESGWSALFHEDAPTDDNRKKSAKETKKQRKQARKDGLSKKEAQATIRDPQADMSVWKVVLWTAVSGIILQALQQAAKKGAEQGANKVTQRRPRPNRG